MKPTNNPKPKTKHTRMKSAKHPNKKLPKARIEVAYTEHKTFPSQLDRPVSARVFYQGLRDVLRETDERIDEKIGAYRRRVIRYEVYCWIAFILACALLGGGFALFGALTNGEIA